MKITKHMKPSDVRAAASLAVDATKGIADLVEAMHATIARPFGMADATTPGRARGITGFVYKAVRGVTQAVGFSVDTALSTLSLIATENESSFERDAAISALNGVLGDYLVRTNNALAIPMSIRCNSEALNLDRSIKSQCKTANGKIVLLIHGLCMNDRQWLHNGHDHGAALATELGYTPLYVRYNTGLHTSNNGESLSLLLEQLVSAWPTPIDEIAIVAHSMGGLVSRSAIEHARIAKLEWSQHVKKMVLLGTPHHGAPLERGGHWIDILLGATPYTKPFARLGKIRSAGITDLRHGNVVSDDWTAPVRARATTPLPGKVKCYAIAATTGKTERDWRDRLLGDGLVPVASALGQHDDLNRALKFPKTRQWIAYECNHMALLSDSRVFAQMTRWLRTR
jgi:pimeloyl-ACP methyl ester carboxylesterase